MGTVASDADLVRAAQTGDRQAFSALFERWFDRSYDVAWRIVRNRDTAAEVAQDTFLTVWTKLDTLRDPDAFGGWVLRSARNKALNRLEREGRSMAFDTDDTVGMIDLQRSAVDVADDIVRNEQADLVWAAAAALGERDASILDLHLRHDLDPAQIAEALDITPNAAHQTLFRLRKRLEGAIRSYVLWHDGRPDCGELAEILDTEGVESFGPTAVKLISRHVTTCDACDERHAQILAPASMFAAVPLVLVGLDVRRAAAAELAAQGVPIDPEVVGGGEDSSGLWQINAGPPPRRRRRAAVLAGVGGALILVVAATVVGAGLIGDPEPTDLALVAAPGTTDATSTTTGPSSTTTASTPSTTVGSATTETAPPDTAPADAAPATTRPPATQPTVPPTPQPTDPPPDTTTPTTQPAPPTTEEEPPTTTSPPAPVIVRFAAIDTGQVCNRTAPGSRLYRLVWLTEEVEEVSFTGSLAAPPGPHPTSGETEGCLPARTTGTWTLLANGPGGTVSDTVAVP